jgi:N-acetylglutamate synthase-like GNAT family acetyltransferase
MSSETQVIRLARREELPALSELAMRSKAVWGYSEAFMEACRQELTLGEERLGSLWVLDRAGTVLGIYALQPRGAGRVELGCMFVDPGHLRRGHGARLVRDAIARARDLGHETMVIHADPNAERFYRAMGAVWVGEAPSESIPGRMLPQLELSLAP